MASASTSHDIVTSHAHQMHDLFNLLCLPVVILVNACAIYVFFFSDTSPQNHSFYWNAQTVTLCTYIFADTIYIILNPKCVSAFKTIIMHHCIVFFGWLFVPQQTVQFRPIATCLLSVEINTVFMIARKFKPFQQHTRLVTLMKCGFYVTWIPLRLIIFPYCCYLGYYEVLNFIEHHGTYINIASAGWLLLLIITFLNVKWSLDLMMLKLGNSNQKQTEE